MLEARVVDTLAAVDRERWNACFVGEIEDYDYLRAVEESKLDGFAFRYLLIEAHGVLRACAPAFLNEYHLETTLKEPMKRWSEVLRRRAPQLITLKLLCLGSPCTETGLIGYAADAGPEERLALTRALVAALEDYAATVRCGLIAYKDIAVDGDAALASVIRPLGYAAVPTLACASLPIDFASVDDYLARLSPGTRKDMRRKLKSRARVEIEVRCTVDDVIDEIMPIYGDTRDRAEMAFEDLTPDYFTGLGRCMGERAMTVLYRVDGELLAANVLLRSDDLLLDKFLLMKPEGRAYNLYYLSWFYNLQYCLDHGLPRYQSGQAAYANKLKLGSRLAPANVWFKHRNPVLNTVLKLISPLLAADDPTEAKAA